MMTTPDIHTDIVRELLKRPVGMVRGALHGSIVVASYKPSKDPRTRPRSTQREALPALAQTAAPPHTIKRHPMDRPRTVGELRPRPALALDPELTVLAAAKKMQAANSDCGLIVSAAGELQGILTDTDVATKVLAPGLSPETTPIAQIMTASPQCVREAENAVDALCTMVERRFRHLPVLDAHGAVVGVLDVAKCLYDAISRLERHLSTASSALSTAVLASMPFGHAGGGSAQQLVDGMVAKLFAPSLADLLNSGTAAARVTKGHRGEDGGREGGGGGR